MAYGEVENERSMSHIQTSNGGFAAVGYTTSFGEINGDILLSKFNSEGTLSWSRKWGGASNIDWAYSLIQTSDGGFAITGYTVSFGAGNADVLLVKFTSDGNLSWSKTWGGTDNDNVISIVQTNDGGLVVTGGTYSFGGASNNVFISKYTNDGTLSWSKTWGGTAYDSASSVIQTSDGGFLL